MTSNTNDTIQRATSGEWDGDMTKTHLAYELGLDQGDVNAIDAHAGAWEQAASDAFMAAVTEDASNAVVMSESWLSTMARGYRAACIEYGTLLDGDSLRDVDLPMYPQWYDDTDSLCARFAHKNAVALCAGPWLEDPQSAGVDLFLTRNRHGAGFWEHEGIDGPLTSAAHALGENAFAVSDDGYIVEV